jgi:Cu/Ag efflux pump CusA
MVTVFDVVVWGSPGARDGLTSVRRLLIDTPGGGHVRLADVADVRVAPSPTAIRRQSVSRYVDVAASVVGRDRDAVVRDVKSRLHSMVFPIEYHAEVLAAEAQPVGRLIFIAIAAVIAMFLLLQAFFGSWRLAALSSVTLPIGVAGGVLAALAAGGKLSFGSYIALFAVFGIATRSGVLLLDHVRRLGDEAGQAPSAALVLRGARDRLVPTLMTASAAAVMFVPVLLMSSRRGYELLDPIAVTLVGGLFTSVAVNLFVLPVLYLRFGFTTAPEPSEEKARDELAPAFNV